jgi:MarR family transcriptional regulator, 2-MHQ and catechol-resistance regulon repressor
MQPNARQSKHSDAALLADAEALHNAVTELVRLYQVRDRDNICCHDISVTQCSALQALIEGGPMRSQALSSALMLDKSTTTRVVDSLVRKHYVERTTELDDRRAVTLKVTRSGRALYARIRRQMVEQQAEVLRDLDPAVRGVTADVLRRLARSAQRQLAGAMGDDASDAACGSARDNC